LKGFKKDGKFIPTGNKSKSSLKKTDVRKKETIGVKEANDLLRTKESLDNRDVTAKELEKIAGNIEEVTFIETKNGRLAVFNPDMFLWNAYGKDSFDGDNEVTDEQWKQFMSENNKYFFLEPDDSHYREFEDWKKTNGIGEEE
jgi:hypothetical protein